MRRRSPSLSFTLYLLLKSIFGHNFARFLSFLTVVAILLVVLQSLSFTRLSLLPSTTTSSSSGADGIIHHEQVAQFASPSQLLSSLLSFVKPRGHGVHCVTAVLEGLVEFQQKGGGAADSLLVHASEAGSGASIPEKFIYVYELDSSYNEGMVDWHDIRWWSQQYEVENEIFDMLARLNMSRTYDPEAALLFYVPFYSARYTLWKHVSEDSPEFLKNAIRNTSSMWENILGDIKTKMPYFKRSNGRDHFSVLSMDHGRCTALLYCDPHVYGEMFFFQLNGDKMVRSIHGTTPRQIQALTYNYNTGVVPDLPDIPCYMSDRDIIIPPFAPATNVTSPLSAERPTVALFRFSPAHHHGIPIPHFHHLVRKELLEMYKDKNIPGWDFGVKTEWASRDEWRFSKFCVAPPGHSQWTSRPAKSIVAGCIPITFERDHDDPWQDDIVYTKFSINIDVEEMASLEARINDILKTPGRLERMQRELSRVQEYFAWGREHPRGARQKVLEVLRRRAQKIAKLRNY